MKNRITKTQLEFQIMDILLHEGINKERAIELTSMLFSICCSWANNGYKYKYYFSTERLIVDEFSILPILKIKHSRKHRGIGVELGWGFYRIIFKVNKV